MINPVNHYSRVALTLQYMPQSLHLGLRFEMRITSSCFLRQRHMKSLVGLVRMAV